MAATDQTYRNQKALDIVFAVSSIAMLVSMIGMFIQDYNREWKTEQREFRDVEAAMFTRQAIMELPDAKRYEEVKKAVEKAREARKTGEERIKQLERDIAKLAPTKERQEQKVGDLKADLASKASFFDSAADHYGASSPQAKGYKEEVEKLETKVAAAQDELDKTLADLKKNQQEKDGIEKPLVVAQTELKRLNDDLIRKARAAIKSQWGFGDWFRNLPVIDAFAAPTKIHQFTLNELTIDYNFKGVTRFDRCMTCHQGIDRPAYTKDRLRALVEEPSAELVANLESAKERLKELPSELAGTSDEANLPRPGDLRLTPLSKNKLTPSRINEFCAHPRLELFVGSNSKHPAEKFGCTSCHAGQGSGTEFKWASHTPNDSKQLKEWKKNLGWESIHFWDFPMLPKRFVEASCLKCHHQVTDLITSGNRQEAPKLFRGYNLIRENGCFGCHEIPGKKNGVPIGPDMRLEPYPPLEMVTAAERARMLADTDNPPGTLRKVGPSLFRLSEKTNKEWMAKWIKSPRSFRPDTKMPHFYGLSNNNEEALKGTGQEKFPDAEAASIAHFLFAESNSYLTLLGDMYKNKDKRDIAYYETIVRETSAEVANKAKFSALPLFEQDALLKKLDDAKTSMIALKQEAPAPIHAEKPPKKSEASLVNGRKLFSERGCLACHNHAGTTTPMSVGKDEKVPAIHSEAHF